MAVIDVAGFIADLKDHAVDHGFHVHDERHFVESYSLRQAWEVDLHPEEACGGPLDLHLSLEVDPRVLLAFEDKVLEIPEGDDPPDDYHFPLLFNWALPPLPHPPDLLVLATDLAGVGGPDLPLEVSAIDSFAAVTDAPERSLAIVAKLAALAWPRSSWARSCSARPSTGAWRSASSCSTPPPSGSTRSDRTRGNTCRFPTGIASRRSAVGVLADADGDLVGQLGGVPGVEEVGMGGEDRP